MPTIRFSRPFTPGSRPTPDPFDQYLDTHGFYRKHTARDSTSLFRVISEQVYDTQDHHQQVRKDCVNFIIKHRDQYESMIQGDFDKYIREMAKTDTIGTLTELRAMGYLYKRNIRLFRPFDLGTWYVKDSEYKEPALQIFHTSHFDSVYKKSYVVDAAFCQSIAYEMLYKKVYKLPDIEYSVETMLHSDINHEPSSHEYENGDEYATHIVFQDGRKFQLDRPENTLCILSDPELCHFHNKNFAEVTSEDSNRFDKSMLSEKYCSCVRQLLFDGITPFPYKVAKSLDENIYRNVEFDSWNETRKAQKSKQNNYKVGVDCLVQLNESGNEKRKFRVNAKETDDETCFVFLEKLGEKRTVPMASLPLNATQRNLVPSRRNDQYATSANNKQSIDRYGSHNVASRADTNENFDDSVYDYDAICKTVDLDTYINLSNFDFPTNNQQELIAYPMAYAQTNNMGTNNNPNTNNVGSKAQKNRNQNTHNPGNLVNDSNEKQQVQMTKIDEENGYTKNIHEPKPDPQQTANHPGGYYQPVQEQHVDNGNVPVNQPHVQNYYHPGAAPVYYCPTPEYNEPVYPPEMVVPQGVYAIPANAYQPPQMQPNMYAPMHANQGNHYPVHVGGWPGYNPHMNPQSYVVPAAPQYAMQAIPAPIPFQLPFLTRDLLRSSGRINFNANYSYAPNGDDLPLNDKVSVRFYYNLGIEYFKLLQNVHGHGQLMAMIDGDQCVGNNNYDQQPNEIENQQQNQIVSDLQQLNFESNEVDVPSPTKVRSFNEFNYGRRGSNTKFKRNDNRPNGQKHFQSAFVGPASKPFTKNNQKYMNNSANSSFDSTPNKEHTGKPHQQGHALSKRDHSNPDSDVGNGTNFGCHVPPFPWPNDQNEPHYGPPANAVYTRMTPPVGGRPSSVPTIPVYHHHQHSNYWPPSPSQAQQHQLQQSQSHSSLNTSAASIPSQ